MLIAFRSSIVRFALGVASLTFGLSNIEAQFLPTPPAGVEIDAQGTLRMRQYQDPTGQLTRHRLAQMKAALDPKIAQPSKLRKVSLTRLETAVRQALESGAGLTDDMRFLAGLTKLQFVFLYPETGDIVIAGPAEGYGMDLSGRAVGLITGKSVLELQDLIVALRAFPPNSEATPVVGCSIDPTQEGLARMQQYLVNVSGQVRPADAQRFAAGLRQNLGHQVVRVEGVSPRTHFAQVLVEADYRMKLIGIGLEKPPVRIASFVSRANPASVSKNALQRWYFVPDYESIRVSDDGMAMELVGNGVKLVGEDEVVSAAGGRSQSGKVDRASHAFVTSFTQHYEELAHHVPVYGQLRNLIDITLAAAYMQENEFFQQAGWALSTFGNEAVLPTETYHAPTQVESAVNVVWKGNTLMTPIGGGVTIQPREALMATLADDKGVVATTQQSIQLGDLAADQWWWD